MRKLSPWVASVATLVTPFTASAGPPDPSMCIVTTSGNNAPCQWRFQPSGSLDQMLVHVEVYDSDGLPCEGLDVEVSLSGAGGTPGNFCTCCPAQVETTDENGVVELTFRKIGGGGLLDVNAEVLVGPGVPLAPVTILFTSSDLNGTCEQNFPVQVEDDGIFALGRNPYGIWSDLNCDGQVNVVDAGVHAGEIGDGCAVSPCP